MTTALAPMSNDQIVDLTAIERVIVTGDLSKLTPDERWNYYKGVCQSVGLNPFTKPFEYITLNNKLTLYALKGATDQLRKTNRISIPRPSIEIADGLVTVTATAVGPDGRTDSDVGIVALGGNVQGEARANAVMKAVTKAKRRVTLSFCGLGMLDETEAESIPSARPANVETLHPLAIAAGPSHGIGCKAVSLNRPDACDCGTDSRADPDPTTCDAERWNRAWHAAVKGTRFEDEETRHKFIGFHTRGAAESLSGFLAKATDDDAQYLIEAIQKRIEAEAKKARAALEAEARQVIEDARDDGASVDVPDDLGTMSDAEIREMIDPLKAALLELEAATA